MIDFELGQPLKLMKQMLHSVSDSMLRPISKRYDTYEHEHDEKKELEQVAALMGPRSKRVPERR